jgi:hypothetical protein
MTSIDPIEVLSQLNHTLDVAHRAQENGFFVPVEKLTMYRDALAQSITRRLNPDREAVWRAVAAGINTTTMNKPRVDQITDAVMDLFAQSSVAGETT